MNITPAEYARGIEVMVDHAHATGGGRASCCQRGQCALHLAEDGAKSSTVHLSHGLAHFPETEGQALTAGAAREAHHLGLRVLGLDPEAFVG